jgi:hypothetical protein
VAINIDIQHTWIGSEEFDDGEVDVVDVAESGGFTFFGMVQTACPIYGDVGCTGCYSLGCTCEI